MYYVVCKALLKLKLKEFVKNLINKLPTLKSSYWKTTAYALSMKPVIESYKIRNKMINELGGFH